MANLPRGMHTLLLTSTVYVNSDMTVLTDPSTRIRQCVDSILYYLRSPWLGALIVCDNSGFDFMATEGLSAAVAASGKRTEFLRFSGDRDKIVEKGKGFGEGQMLEYILRESLLLKEVTGSFFKVTGRLVVENFDTIAGRVKPGKTYFQGVGRNPFVRERKVDTRFYYCNRALFENTLLSTYRQVDDRNGRYLEHEYYRSLRENRTVYSGFGIPPLFSGISGSTGLSYSIGRFKRIYDRWLNFVTGNRF